jgi:hypothetical protein
MEQVMEGPSIAFEWKGDAFEPVDVLHERALAVIPSNPTLADVRRVEALLMTLPQAAVRSVNHHAPDVCVREGFIPAGTIVTGRMHRHAHLCILASGTIEVSTDNGMQRLTGPLVIHSEAGTKRIAHAITDVVWYAIHATNETDEAKLIDELTYPEPVAFGAHTLSLLDGGVK